MLNNFHEKKKRKKSVLIESVGIITDTVSKINDTVDNPVDVNDIIDNADNHTEVSYTILDNRA